MNTNPVQKGLRGGFTLIEILVVLVIMGFLVAMVAPKLSGIVDSAVGTTSDTSQERLSSVLNSYAAQNNALPNGYINLVVVDDDANLSNVLDAEVSIPMINDGDKSNGAEFLSAEFDDRFKPQVHFLDDAEAAELIEMGVKMTRALAKVDTVGKTLNAKQYSVVEKLVSQPVADGMPVMMAGVGFDKAGTTVTWAEGNEITIASSVVTEDTTTSVAVNLATASNANENGGANTLARMDEGKHFGRILMGIGNFSELVNSGMLEEAGVSPTQTQMNDHYTWGNYVAVLPRLNATMNRLNGEGITKLHIVSLDVESGKISDGNTVAGRTPMPGCKVFTAQKASDVLTANPEGHTWGSNTDSSAIVLN
jgi:prepilin-type N-terminal cleavage/methylation domain-containing protein